MAAVPSAARAACVRGWLLAPACPRLVPTSGRASLPPQIVAGCSGGPTMNAEPLASRQCRFAQWSYLTVAVVPGTRGKDATFLSSLPPAPPYFVHVLVYGAAQRSDLPFALPGGPPQHLTDALLQSSHPGHAILLGRVRWAGRDGELILAPSYPGGGEVGSHLVFSYRTGAIYRGISLHPWSSYLRYRAGMREGTGAERTIELAPDPAYPEVVKTLETIVRSTGEPEAP